MTIPKAKGTRDVVAQIELQRCRDILTTAAEGGINYWALDPEDFNGFSVERDEDGYVAVITLHPSESNTELKCVRIDDAALCAALGKAFSIDDAKYSAGVELAFTDFDAASADVIVQVAAFGKVIYG